MFNMTRVSYLLEVLKVWIFLIFLIMRVIRALSGGFITDCLNFRDVLHL
jgi:hypothetical protein